jgi:hypothetical protein
MEVINFLKALPAKQYASYESVLRDFAEAERRFADPSAARDGGPGRENIGRRILEETPGVPTRHP